MVPRLTDSDELLNDGIGRSLQGVEGSTIAHVALEVAGVGVLLDRERVARLHHLDSRDAVSAQGSNDGRHRSADVVQKGLLVRQEAGHHGHDSVLDFVDDLGGKDAQKLLENVVEGRLKTARGGAGLSDAGVALGQTSVFEDGVQAGLELALSVGIKTGLGQVDSSDGITDGILNRVESVYSLQ